MNFLVSKIKSAKRLHKHILLGVACLFVVLGVAYWFYSERYISTDDAYINANVVQVSSQVSGPIIKLAVKNNQFVKSGQLLFEIDPTPFQLAVDKASAELSMALVDLQHSKYVTARTETLVKQKALPEQSHDDAVAQFQGSAARAQLAKAMLQQAELNLFYTKIFAATDGWVTNMSLREGDVVPAQQPVFALISSSEFWVDANFKETELQNIHPKQKVKITVDMYSDYVFTGVVDSLSGGSGAAFSLLPPENATGNWVKVTQRVPVKVLITNVDKNHPLRIGTTATVRVDVGAGG
jgi:membrane fusion protein, multidrug efflux system